MIQNEIVGECLWIMTCDMPHLPCGINSLI
uniref:Uncharacterized protein n=1 Tax=Arundo donax TaxID=35708 RepID=A0A0A9DXC6_ARUDO